MGGAAVRIEEFVAVMERVAPVGLACEFDNPGLLIGPENREIRSVLVALDATVAVAREAAQTGAELVLAHHPLFFHPVQRILPDDPDTAAAYALIRNGVGLYAAHTNLDSAEGGVNDALCTLYGLTDVGPYADGLGRVGTLPMAMPLADFKRLTDRLLNTDSHFVGRPERIVTRVAVLGGAGGDTAAGAAAAGADVLLTGEMKHHEAIAVDALGMAAIVGGHYETERIVLPPLIARLQRETNDVQYNVARSDSAPFAQL